MLEYYEWYCLLDTVLLLEVMNDFKKRSRKSFNLSIDGYWTLSSYALNACLKLTRANIELLTDKTMYEFIEKNKKGGLTMAIQRFATSSIGDEILRKDFRNLVGNKLLDGVKSDNFF